MFVAQHGDLELVCRPRCIHCDHVISVPHREYPLPLPQMRDYDDLRQSRDPTIPQDEWEADIQKLMMRDTAALDHAREHNKKCVRKEWNCPECGGEVRTDLFPMCPVCRSRNVRKGKTLVFLD